MVSAGEGEVNERIGETDTTGWSVTPASQSNLGPCKQLKNKKLWQPDL